jgi:hypothetical protein
LAVTFQPELPILSSNSNYPKSVFAADLDGDNDADLVVASLIDDKVSWYENLDSQGNYGQQKVVTDLAVGASSVHAADLDGDGDADIISGGASTYDSDVSWYENDGQGNFGAQQVISADVQGTDSVFAADIDGDGDLDVLSASREDDKVAWYPNEDSQGSFGDQELITDTADGATRVFAHDLDGDGDMDVVAASYTDNSVRWFENENGGNFSNEVLLSDTATAVTAVTVADVDADSNPDIIFTSREDNTVGWFKNLGIVGGSLEFGPEQVISLDVVGPNELYIADLDGDSLPDITIAGRTGDTVTWHKNLGDGLFDSPKLVSLNADGASSVFAVDADGDGDLDLFSASRFDDKVAFYRNLDGAGTFSDEQVMTIPGSLGAQHVGAADVDGDGDLDVLAAAYAGDTVSWFENLNGNGSIGPERVISNRVNGAEVVQIGDLDGDGDGDAVSASFRDNKIAWYENIDGKGNFGIQRIITGDTAGPEYVEIADIDRDGDNDLLSASRNDNKVAWYENTDGLGTFGPQVIVSLGQIPATYVHAADFDGDGDLDIVSNGYDRYEANLAWFENVDGEGTFGPESVITLDVSFPTSVQSADVDDDGDLDLLATSGGDDRVIWYENQNGDGDFDQGRLVSDAVDGAFSAQASDIDGDGDLDVVAAGILGSEIFWFENDGTGVFAAGQLISDTGISPTSIHVADLDRDGDPDVLSSDSELDLIAWYRNLNDAGGQRGDFNDDNAVDILDVDLLCAEILDGGLNDDFDLTDDGSVTADDVDELVLDILQTTYGDANLDGVFNSADFVVVFAAGEYEDDILGNSTWADGDWNCDGDFSTGDLVFALSFGGYISGASPAADLWAIAAATQAQRRPRP